MTLGGNAREARYMQGGFDGGGMKERRSRGRADSN